MFQLGDCLSGRAVPCPHTAHSACKPTQTSLSPNAESPFTETRVIVPSGRGRWSTLLQNKSFEFLYPGSNTGDGTDKKNVYVCV